MENATTTPKTKTSPKDFFIHLLSILALYFSAASFLVLIFQYINILVPDVLNNNAYDQEGYVRDLRYALASLIIIFPVYLFSNYFLNKSFVASPEKRFLRIRRWLVYFTLFATACIVIGDLVYLLYTFLNGEVTLRFILKVLGVFFVSSSIFTYYFWDMKLHPSE